jgi:hypothetical protein
LVVWHWDGAREALTEIVALPGEAYRWSFVAEDGALIVGTGDAVSDDGPPAWGGRRFVTAVTPRGEEALRCW